MAWWTFTASTPGRSNSAVISARGDAGVVREGELQGVDQDGLAGARFPGEHTKAGAELQFEGLHDDEVAQNDASEAHGCKRRGVDEMGAQPLF